MKTKTAWPLLALILSFLVLAGAIVYASNKSRITVHFSIQTSQPDRLQVFHDAEGRFSEANSVWVETAGDSRLDSALKIRGRDAMRLRLDPPTAVVTTVCDLRFGRAGVPAQFEVLDTSEVFVTRTAECLQFQPDSAARDPQLVLRFVDGSASRINSAGWWRWVMIAAFVVLIPVCGRLGYLLLHRMSELVRFIPIVPGFDRFQKHAHWVCAAMMLVFGAAYVFVTPPGAVADEEAHLAKIIRISEGVPFGDSGSKPMPNPRVMYGPFTDYLSNKSAFTGEQLGSRVRQPLACEATTTSLSRAANGYFPHQYLLPSLVFKVGCATSASFGWFLYLARALNLLLATMLVTYGVRQANRGKWALLAVALLPMSLFQMSSLSADALTLSLSIAWLGLLSGIAGGTVSLVRATPALWTLSLAVACLKPGSAWILASLLFCKSSFDRAGRSFPAALARHVALPWIIHVGLALWAAGAAKPLPGVDAAANLASLFADPSGFVHAMMNTFLGARTLVLAKMMVGVLGWLDVWLSTWAYGVAAAVLLMAWGCNDAAGTRAPRYVKPLALLFATGSLAMIALPLFIYWTRPGAAVVDGLQGRYFTVTTAFVLAWCSFRSPPAIRAWLIAAIVAGLSLINLHALHRLYEAYFVVGRL